MDFTGDIFESDEEIAKVILGEMGREQGSIELVSSENYASKAVLQAMGSVLTNKYSEGYPNKRYYGGQRFIDTMEAIAIERAKQLFKCEHVNIQPYSGSSANMAVFFTLLKQGDKFMGMELSSGGHLTHGSQVNFSGRLYKPVPYNVNKETGLLDMEQIRKQAIKEKPKMIISGFTAYPRRIDFKAFQQISEEIGAYHMSDISHIAGLCITGVHESPVSYSDVVTTTTHKTLRGPRGAIIMCKREDRLKEKYHPECKKDLAEMIDSNVFPGMQGGPHNHVNAAKAVAFGEALKPGFKDYAKQILKNAKALAGTLMSHGVKLVTDGTDNHLILIDLRPKGLAGKGKEMQDALEKAGIVANKNTLPYEPCSPFNPSGLRIGTPAVTTRGMKESEMKEIGGAIAKVIDNYKNESILQGIKNGMIEIARQFPLYSGMGILK